MVNRIIRFFLENKLVTVLVLLLFIGWGLITAPFSWQNTLLPRDPVPVDAIPNLGENQQIVFTKWPGRSPQDVQDQITYPLTTALLGVPGVKTIRSSSMFGFSSIYVIFEEDIDFYWSRSRILEKLNSLPADMLPEGVKPSLGPDATALGQIYWYTLEGRDPQGNPTGGWDLHKLRSVQDYYVRYGLSSAKGVAEVASIGGFVKEYQIDVNPNAMKYNDITFPQLVKAVKESNLDVGANTLEINRVEYFVRGLGYIKNKKDLEQAVVTTRNNVPIRISDVAQVKTGPAERRGILDKGGSEVVGGVVVAREGANPLETIRNVKKQIDEISTGLPSKTLEDGTKSKLTIVPFYDRSNLIHETLGTLEEALTLEVIITIIVILVMVLNLRASILISGLLPVAVLMCFIAMRYFGVDANIVALSGIAIAIGTMVDLGIVLSENMLRHLKIADPDESRLEVIYRATTEVSSAVLTAVTTTIVSFIPVFTLQQEEGKLFRPLAFTKTFALIAALIMALLILPALAHWLFGIRVNNKRIRAIVNAGLLAGGFVIMFFYWPAAGLILMAFGIINLSEAYGWPGRKHFFEWLRIGIVVLAVSWGLTHEWLPLGPSHSMVVNYIFVFLILGAVLGLLALIVYYYPVLLGWCLQHKKTFLLIPALLVFLSINIWLGFNSVFGWVARGFDKLGVDLHNTAVWSGMDHAFPGVGEEFMPDLDEGSFLLMPTTMPHAGMKQNKNLLQKLDMAVNAIPEVKQVVGKAGRVSSALDPAPMSMFENIIQYKDEYIRDEHGRRQRFTVNDEGLYLRKDSLSPVKGGMDINPDNLITSENGQYYRQWRDNIHSPDDIWQEIISSSDFPALTSAPKLQPIETRQIMLQSGMRAPMGIKVRGPDLKTIQDFGFKLEKLLKQVASVKKEAVFADRIVGKPYLEIKINRQALGRYGLTVEDVQKHIQVAVGGKVLTRTVEGRERYPVRVRYPREMRNDPQAIRNILISTGTNQHIPLSEIADIKYRKGPQVIKSEDTFLTGYVLFDKTKGVSNGEVVEQAKQYIQEKVNNGTLKVPEGVSYFFAGDYKNQQRAEKRLSVIVPLVLVLIFLLIYFQFRSISTTLMVFSGIVLAFAGGFLMIWFYGMKGFMDFTFMGESMRDIFQIHTVHLSVAVWVGFIALFGIATDNGVVLATYLQQVFAERKPEKAESIRHAVIEAGRRRARPCLMTTATTLLAFLPILTSTGKGSNIMVPMAIPSFGGMAISILTLFMVPVLYAIVHERKIKKMK